MAYSKLEFQQYLFTSKSQPSVRDIDIASTLAALLGIPIPAENYGTLIPEFYTKRMDTDGDPLLYSHEEKFYITLMYHYYLNVQ